MSSEPEQIDGAAETVAAVIAEQAAEIVAETNSEIEQARAVTDAVVAAHMENIHQRAMDDFRAEIIRRVDAAEANQTAMQLELAECLRTQNQSMTLLTEIQATLAGLTPAPSPLPPVVEVAPEKTEAPPPEARPEKLETPPEEKPEPPARKKRRLI